LKNDDGRIENIRAIPKEDMACKYVVAQLEQLLASAKQGEIKNIFAICELRTDDPMFVQAGSKDVLRTLGLLDWATARWRETQITDFESEPE
jgi:hypothetical protein